MDSENFTLSEREISQGLANVGMSWDHFDKEKKKKKMTSFSKEPLDLLDPKGAINYDLRSTVKKAGRKTKKKRKSKKRGGVRGKRPPPLAITKEELDEVPGEPDDMHRDETEELKAFRRAIGVDEEEEDDSEREAKSTSPDDGDKENLPSPSKKAKMAGGSRKKRRRRTKRRRKSRKSRKGRKTRRHRK